MRILLASTSGEEGESQVLIISRSLSRSRSLPYRALGCVCLTSVGRHLSEEVIDRCTRRYLDTVTNGFYYLMDGNQGWKKKVNQDSEVAATHHHYHNVAVTH
uniref:Uncharacterized protein n=1 Tax=Parascaris equorum TaxID=6256 RepID=A0A914S7D9_PAREQ